MSGVVGETLTIVRADGEVLCAECRVAASFSSRLRGLLGHRELPPGRGVLLSRTNFVHTHFMRFPIDVVWLAEGLEVVRVVPALAPWRLARCRDASAALELPAGAAARAGLRAGERLALVSGLDEGAAQPIRVAVTTRDRRFDRVASFLLARSGFTVTRGRDGESLTELARSGAVDVVILDSSDSVAAAGRLARSLEALAPQVGVVFVADEEPNGRARPGGLDRKVAKWGSFDRIVAAVERAYAAGGARLP